MPAASECQGGEPNHQTVNHAAWPQDERELGGAKERKTTAGALVSEIDGAREQRRNLSSAIRTFVLAYYVSQDERRARALEPHTRPKPVR